MRRRDFITVLGAMAATWPRAARAQQPAMPVIGFLASSLPDTFPDRMRAFFQGLSEAGFDEGRNLTIEYRWAGGQYDRLPALAADLVQRNVNVIAAIGGPAQALAAKAATSTIPVVFQVGVDPVEIGLVTNLARPSGNVTGVASLNMDVARKRLEVMHELLPAATSFALLFNPSTPASADIQMREFQAAARTLGIELQTMPASTEGDFDAAFAAMVKQRVGGLLIGVDVLFTSRNAQLAELAVRNKLPTISPYREFPAAGGLMSYGGDIGESWHLAGVYTGRVLRGEKPASLPVQQSTKVELILNLKTAKALGISVPLSLLGRADEIIE
jgi:putative ABC transport system substrate-binding protein